MIRVMLFGKIDVRVAGESNVAYAESLPTAAQKLLAYLLLHRDRPHARERLGGLFWQHGSTRRTKAYLRKAIWQIQHVFENEPQTDAHADVTLLDVDGDWIRLSREVEMCLDVETLEHAFSAVRNRHGTELSETEAHDLSEAVRLYTADLLENWYASWCLLERERLRDLYLMALKKLSRYAEHARRYEEGIAWGMQMLAVDPARECAHRQLMRLRYLAGDRTGALRQYVRCARILEAELGVDPAAATHHLHTEIREDTLSLRSQPPDTASAPSGDGIQFDRSPLPPRSAELDLFAAEEATPPHELVDTPTRERSGPDEMERILQMKKTLTGLQSQIRRELDAINSALHRKEE